MYADDRELSTKFLLNLWQVGNNMHAVNATKSREVDEDYSARKVVCTKGTAGVEPVGFLCKGLMDSGGPKFFDLSHGKASNEQIADEENTIFHNCHFTWQKPESSSGKICREFWLTPAVRLRE